MNYKRSPKYKSSPKSPPKFDDEGIMNAMALLSMGPMVGVPKTPLVKHTRKISNPKQIAAIAKDQKKSPKSKKEHKAKRQYKQSNPAKFDDPYSTPTVPLSKAEREHKHREIVAEPDLDPEYGSDILPDRYGSYKRYHQRDKTNTYMSPMLLTEREYRFYPEPEDTEEDKRDIEITRKQDDTEYLKQFENAPYRETENFRKIFDDDKKRKIFGMGGSLVIRPPIRYGGKLGGRYAGHIMA